MKVLKAIEPFRRTNILNCQIDLIYFRNDTSPRDKTSSKPVWEWDDAAWYQFNKVLKLVIHKCCAKIPHKAVTWDKNPWWEFWQSM